MKSGTLEKQFVNKLNTLRNIYKDLSAYRLYFTFNNQDYLGESIDCLDKSIRELQAFLNADK